MVKVIDSETVIRAYFRKYRDQMHLSYSDLKKIRYKAEPHVGAYIDVTYSSLRRLQLVHRGDLTMDRVQITIVKDTLREIRDFETPVVQQLEQYL